MMAVSQSDSKARGTAPLAFFLIHRQPVYNYVYLTPVMFPVYLMVNQRITLITKCVSVKSNFYTQKVLHGDWCVTINTKV